MSIRLTLLGAGTCLPVPGYSPSSHFIELPRGSCLLDIGPGAVARLQAAGHRYQDLTHVCLTHLHSDHTLDLMTLLQANNAGPGWGREEPLAVIGPPGLKAFLSQLMTAFEGTRPEAYLLDIIELGDAPIRLPWGELRSAPTGHTGNSCAVRIDAGDSTLVYTGDVAQIAPLIDLARHADGLLCECSFPAGWKTSDHLTADQAGRLAAQAGVGHLVLTHFYPSALQADLTGEVRRHYAGRLTLGRDGTMVEFPEGES
jgi:ribonuclease BN (tRNA processing enzyme)